jgi:hypothetical protein
MADSGKAIVWVRQAGGWTQQAELMLTGSATGDAAGRAVALEGDLAFVGAPGRAGGGIVEVFGRGPGGNWSSVAVLMPPAAQPGRQFGSAVALMGDFVFVGAPGDAGNGHGGAVFVFRRTNPTTWPGVTVLRGFRHGGGRPLWGGACCGVRATVAGAPGKNGETGAVYRFSHRGKHRGT